MIRKLVNAMLFTLAWALLAMFVIGFSQLGDCYTQEPHLSACLAAKVHNRQILHVVFGAGYLVGLWLISRRRKIR